MVYFISSKFQGIRKAVSIAMVMLLSILPDIDMVFRLAGIDLGHRTFTHSAIIWLLIGGITISFFTIKYRKGSAAAVYLIAYLSHLLIGDIIVAPINLLYPLRFHCQKSNQRRIFAAYSVRDCPFCLDGSCRHNKVLFI